MNKTNIKNWAVFLTVLLLITTISISINGRDKVTMLENAIYTVVSPVQTFFTSLSGAISHATYPIRNIFIIGDENINLKKEVDRLHQELIQQTLSKAEYEDLRRLKKALNYTTTNSIKNFVTADVISRDPSNWYNMFVINVGENEGIVKESMVINQQGLIGQVYEAGADYAKVVTISDIKGAVSFEILDNERIYDGIVKGNVDGGFDGYFFDPNADVRIGDQLITSGLGIYPKGVLIGEITKIDDNKDSLLKTIVVKSYVDFKTINRVLVIPPHSTLNDNIK